MASTTYPAGTNRSAMDVVIVIDTTGSMDPYLRALERFLPQLITLRTLLKPSTSNLTEIPDGKFIDKIGILSYSDYYLPPQLNSGTPLTSVQNPIPPNDEAEKAMRPKLKVENVTAWSGWDDGQNATGGRRLIEWVKGLVAEGGGDYPEAAKTALRRVLDLVETEQKEGSTKETLVLWYTDAPPHHRAHRSLNRLLEIAAYDSEPSGTTTLNSLVSTKKLNAATPLPPTIAPSKCLDWMALCLSTQPQTALPADFIKEYTTSNDSQSLGGVKVWTILPPTLPDSDLSFWNCLGTISGGGTCVVGGPQTERPVKGGTGGRREELKKSDKVKVGEEVMMTSGTTEFVKRIVEASRTIIMGSLGLVLRDKASVALGDTKGKGKAVDGEDLEEEIDMDISDSEKRKKRNEKKQMDWIRLLSFEDDIHQFLSVRPQQGISMVVPTNPPQDLGNAIDSISIPGGEGVTPSLKENASRTSGVDENTMEMDSVQKALPKLRITNEDEGSLGFLPPPWKGPQEARWGTPLRTIIREGMKPQDMENRIFASSGLANKIEASGWIRKIFEDGDETYRLSIVAVLKGVAGVDVEAISLVWVFVELWRCITSSPPSTGRDTLLAEYTTQVTKMKDRPERERSKLLKWANINHDASSEVRKLLEEDGNIAMDTGGLKENTVLIMENDAVQSLELTREGILELARTVDKKVLKRVADMLRYTRIATSTEGIGSRTISMETSPPVLFRVIPHMAIEGLLYSPRAAAITAILAVLSPIPHLSTQAQQLLSTTRGNWLSSSTSENFAPEFIHFILSLPPSIQELTLSEEERAVYEGMGRYSALESELMDRKVDALVPWTPMKTRGVGDRKRICVGCGMERSDTMMVQVGTYEFKKHDTVGEDGGDRMRCGMCVDSVKDPLTFKTTGIMESCWVECSERWCRAQYVIEDEEGLRIPPRCYYCRKRKPCPWIECTICTNRVILPKSYRIPSADTTTSFICPPCQFSRPIGPSSASLPSQASYTGHQTIVHKLTTLRSILFANEYEVGWLGIKPFQEVFRGRSTFMIWELYSSGVFTPYSLSASSPHAVMPLEDTKSRSSTPPTPTSASSHGKGNSKRRRLQVNGKALLNPAEVKEELDMLVNMVLKKGSERCGLSLDLVRATDDWVTSCGNGGCTIRVSRKAWDEWFSGTGRRRLCPACRRAPLSGI